MHRRRCIALVALYLAFAYPAIAVVESGMPQHEAPSPPVQTAGSRATWIEMQKLLASDGEPQHYFGQSVAISGNTALIGAHFGNDDRGAAYIFARTGIRWAEQAILTAPDGAVGDQFGISVALHEDTALIGAYYANNGMGAVYVFTRTGATWTFQQKLTPTDGETSGYFGVSVSLFGDTALIGAFTWGGGMGGAYVFTRTGTTWTGQQRLFSPTPVSPEWFGISVSLFENTALIGAVGHWTTNGSAYVFSRAGTAWSFQRKLSASDGEADDNFGYAVALYEGTALIGAYGDDDNGDQSGSSYVFTRSGSTWSEQQKLLPSDGELGDSFGSFVALDDDAALIGAYWSEDGKGSAYAFTRAGATWAEQQKLSASDGVRPDWFGWSLCLSGDTALVGAYNDDNGTGSVYAFSLDSGATVEEETRSRPAAGMISALSILSNPARGGAQVRFALARDAAVELAVFDAAGRCIRGIPGRCLPMGECTLLWDARDDAGHAVANGVYLIRVRAGGDSRSERVAIVRIRN